MTDNATQPPSPFTRSSTAARDGARSRVRTATALGAAGALLGTGMLTVALVPATSSTTSTTTATAAAAETATSSTSTVAPSSLTDTADTTTTSDEAATTSSASSDADTISGGS